MSRPPPPPTFPTPNWNATRSSTYPPPQPGPVYPPQQSATYAPSQPLQPPSAHGDRDLYSVNTHAPPSTSPYPSSQSYPSAHSSSEPPQTPWSVPIHSVQGGNGASTSFSGAPPPPMMQRVMTMPTPGQEHNPVPYHNLQAPVIDHQPSYSGMSGGTRSVPGDWSHQDPSYAYNEDLVQRSEAADSSSNFGLTKGPPNNPGAGKPVPCKHCGRGTSRKTYDSLGGFCKEKHRNEWYAKQNQNQNQNQNQYNQNLVQHSAAAEGSSNLGLMKGPPSVPGAGRTEAPCNHCGRMTPRMTYDSLGGFCKEKHRNEWYAKHNQNQHQYRQYGA